MRLTAKTKKILYFLGFLVVVTLAGFQWFLEHRLLDVYVQIQGNHQIARAQGNIAQAKTDIVSIYKQLTRDESEREYLRPETPVEFYTTVEKTLRDYGIILTAVTPQQVSSSGELGLSVTFAGPYYSFIKAMAALRQSSFLMKTVTLTLTYHKPVDGDPLGAAGNVSGNMTILSALKN